MCIRDSYTYCVDLVENITLDVDDSCDNSATLQVQWYLAKPLTYIDNYFIVLSPPIESGSIFTTHSTTIQFSVHYNLKYNISVVANNCAGNSTPVNITTYTCKQPL